MKIEKGDTIRIYVKRGASPIGVVREVDEASGTIYVEAYRRNAPGVLHSASGWYTPRISRHGVPYVVEE